MSKNYAKRDFKKRTRKKSRNNHAWLWLVTGILIGGFGFSLVFLKKHVPISEQSVSNNRAPAHPASTAAHHAAAKSVEKSASNEDKTSYDFYTMLPNRQVQSTNSSTVAPASPTSEPPVKPNKPLAEAEQFLLTKTNAAAPSPSSTAAIPTPAPVSAPALPKVTNAAAPTEPVRKAVTAKTETGEPMDLTSFKNTLASAKPSKKPVDDGTHYSLDMGSFDSYEKADTRKAELLIAGFNHIQIETYLKNDATWHRVLIGHYKAKSEAERTQKELNDNRFQAQIISSP